MSAPLNPSEVAREVLLQLAQRRIPPTPDNYQRLYYEIAGGEAAEAPFPERYVARLARRLPRDNAERQRLARQLEQALAGGDGAAAEAALGQYLDALAIEPPPAWNELIARLLRQWEGRQLGWTTARKRESLERVLAASDPATLYARLQALLGAWGQTPTDPELPPTPHVPDLPSAPAAATAEGNGGTAATEVRLLGRGESVELLANLRELLLLTLDTVVPAMLGDDAALLQDAREIATTVRGAADRPALDVGARQLRKFALRLEGHAADNAELRNGLLDLLRLLLTNIDELVLDDQWLHGQVETLRTVLDQTLDVRVLDNAERQLKEVIYKQSQLKHNLVEAQRNLKAMLAGFVDQLARFSASTDTYQGKLGDCAQKIANARDITEIGHLLDEVMAETIAIRDETRRSHDELLTTRERVESAEAQMAAMQRALDEASRLMRHDTLTNALNRRGLEDMFGKESSRAQRHHTGLCLALLDLDNFKRLNDTLGHSSGDGALLHLATVVRRLLRPHDTLARYGGEEFVILYPDADLAQAEAALIRLQRELTRSFFMSNQQKIVITFSAGVTPVILGEPLEQALARADAAMYRAKQNGKNQVVAAPANP
ncbi:diguanylate cyclase [Azoarcus olearius]|uniref:GGDEF domain-containing protein n=1 Tax=Azoarcus sp. (strain BH72) TaxID=418699 RepID=UPI0008063CB0|nr:GGDEF domain-containing protein [Azoarcus olearius]ANQ85855.1 diguanylate cyclase [Azoarcus olearius]